MIELMISLEINSLQKILVEIAFKYLLKYSLTSKISGLISKEDKIMLKIFKHSH